MKSRGAPPPPGAAPAVSREAVNMVKKKLSAPSSAPPVNMKSITNRGTAYGGIDEDDGEDDTDEEETPRPKRDEEPSRSSGAKDIPRNGSGADITRINDRRSDVENDSRQNSGAKDSARSGSEVDNVRTIDYRNNADNDDRSLTSHARQGSFHQPRRAPYRQHLADDDHDDDDDEGSFEYESDDHNAHGKGAKAPPKIDPRDRPISIPTNFSGGTVISNPLERVKRDNRERDNTRDRERGGDRDRERNRERNNDKDKERSRDFDRGDRDQDRSNGNRSGAATPKAGTPRKPVTYNFQPLLKATYRELRSFVLAPCDPGITTKCYIERTRGGGNMFAPVYSLCADLEDGTGRELLVCRKVLQSMSSHYVFSLKTEDLYRKRDQRSRLFLGKLRSTSSSEYVLYDNGMVRSTADRDNDNNGLMDDEDEVDDRDAKEDSKDEVSLFRKELAVIYFNTKKRPAPLGTRGSEICIPTVRNIHDTTQSDIICVDKKADPKSPSGISSNSGQSLQIPFQTIRNDGKQNQLHAKKCFIMHERTSRYDPLSSCLVDFKGRANMASVKNFQLIQSYCQDSDAKKSQEMDTEREYILQVGKTTVECFNMDYRYPLSMLQAFAIAIARFDAKLSW